MASGRVICAYCFFGQINNAAIEEDASFHMAFAAVNGCPRSGEGLLDIRLRKVCSECVLLHPDFSDGGVQLAPHNNLLVAVT